MKHSHSTSLTYILTILVIFTSITTQNAEESPITTLDCKEGTHSVYGKQKVPYCAKDFDVHCIQWSDPLGKCMQCQDGYQYTLSYDGRYFCYSSGYSMLYWSMMIIIVAAFFIAVAYMVYCFIRKCGCKCGFGQKLCEKICLCKFSKKNSANQQQQAFFYGADNMDIRERNDLPLISHDQENQKKVTEEFEIVSKKSTDSLVINPENISHSGFPQMVEHQNQQFVVQQGVPVNNPNFYSEINYENIDKVEETVRPIKFKDIDIPNYDYPKN